jgi:hypothetical protein
MYGNFTSLSFTAGTKDLVMTGPLVAETDADLKVPVEIEVQIRKGGKTIESCKSNPDTFTPAYDPPGGTWSMTKSTNNVAQGDQVTAHGIARDAEGTVQHAWDETITIA